ncbi:MAG: hypothetical protein J07HQX50_00931 [Haloquadratum sp. J07HQX50]|nr:MAG: hypothetical protein J07HQX50_00931 [Haloquadratum sp. J07HQX50]
MYTFQRSQRNDIFCSARPINRGNERRDKWCGEYPSRDSSVPIVGTYESRSLGTARTLPVRLRERVRFTPREQGVSFDLNFRQSYEGCRANSREVNERLFRIEWAIQLTPKSGPWKQLIAVGLTDTEVVEVPDNSITATDQPHRYTSSAVDSNKSLPMLCKPSPSSTRWVRVSRVGS